MIKMAGAIVRTVSKKTICKVVVTCCGELAESTEMLMPGDNTTVDLELMYPVALEEELRFAVREGGRTVGSGVITSVEG